MADRGYLCRQQHTSSSGSAKGELPHRPTPQAIIPFMVTSSHIASDCNAHNLPHQPNKTESTRHHGRNTSNEPSSEMPEEPMAEAEDNDTKSEDFLEDKNNFSPSELTALRRVFGNSKEDWNTFHHQTIKHNLSDTASFKTILPLMPW